MFISRWHTTTNGVKICSTKDSVHEKWEGERDQPRVGEWNLKNSKKWRLRLKSIIMRLKMRGGEEEQLLWNATNYLLECYENYRQCLWFGGIWFVLWMTASNDWTTRNDSFQNLSMNSTNSIIIGAEPKTVDLMVGAKKMVVENNIFNGEERDFFPFFLFFLSVAALNCPMECGSHDTNL